MKKYHRTLSNFSALLVGVLFSLGLGLSGMTRPEKITGFLNVFGEWDPSLLGVMLGAISIHWLSYRWLRGRASPLFSLHFYVPSRRDLTPSLLLGSAIFGTGWGMAGLCPAPALASIASGNAVVFSFLLAMIAGMALNQLKIVNRFQATGFSSNN